MKEPDVIQLIGRNRWKDFQLWMRGQTVGVYPDGSTNYYENDVQDFIDGCEPRD
jgi:hypothetical protein